MPLSLTVSLSQFYSCGSSREGPVSSWQTKASCHVSIFFCLSHPGSEGCVPPGHCWGTVWHQLPARTHTARSKVLPGGLRFLPCRNLMIPGAVQCICHTDHNAPAQTEVRRDSYLTPSKISAAELPIPEVTVAGQAHPAQAEDSHSCSRRQGQRISCPVKARSLCDRTRKRMRGLIPGGWGGRQLWGTAMALVQTGSPWRIETHPDPDPTRQGCQCTPEASEPPQGLLAAE